MGRVRESGAVGRVAVAILAVCAALALMVALAGCGGSGGSGAGGSATGNATGNATGSATGGNVAADASATGAAFDPPAQPAMPATSDGSPIDATHASDGYVIAQASSASRLKFQVVNGDATYNYDLPNDGTPTVFPVNMGDGPYRFRIMKNTEGSNYVEMEALDQDVALTSEFAPFLVPNQFCDYAPESDCVQLARQITEGAANQGDAVRIVCEYVVGHVSYDTGKAQELSTTTGYIPDPDDTLATGTGVCFDYASLGAAMLRSLGFPAKVITGYVSPDDLYHAWVMVYADGAWHTAEFSVDPDTWSRVDLTFAASGGNAFTGDGTSYTDRYVY